MNKVFLIGNLTRDPELTETSAGTSICRFSIAVNRRSGSADGERKADFYRVTAWRQLGETVARYAKKGNKVAVIGNIELNSYTDKEGTERTSVDVIAQDVEFLTPKGSTEDYGDNNYSQAPAPSSSSGRKKPALQSFDDDGDIPF
ncbi:MAG: single-stranded DNA-binding protein [Clostridia bacterium]|nr:single-stranded DNA-binding protein [Clostridia bacterium]MCD8308811.1 single-stranded DNA-binding protein [Clostridia bacterium]